MLHFASRCGFASSCVMGGRHRMRDLQVCDAANDNRARGGANDDVPPQENALLEAALRMIAAHGLSAGLRACEAAKIAADGGDQDGAAWWLAVCTTFDEALARTTARNFAERQMGER